MTAETLGALSAGGGPHADHADLHNDSGEFPDLLDSESNLESLSTFKPFATRSKVEHEESGLTFATLSGVKPVYPEGVGVHNKESHQVVVARKSAAAPFANKTATSIVKPELQQMQPMGPEGGKASDLVGTAGGLGSVKAEDLVNVLASEAMSQLSQQIKLPAGTCLVPSDAKCEPMTYTTTEQGGAAGAAGGQLELIGTALQNNQSPGGSQTNPMTITIQYKIYPDNESAPQKVAVQRDLADIISEAPQDGSGGNAAASVASTTMSTTTPLPSPSVPAVASGSMASATTSTPTTPKSTAKVKPVGADVDPTDLPAIPVTMSGPDPSKDVRKEISPMGKEFDVPTIVSGGYDLDQLMCTICTKTFKNDKTLMSHMLHHFGVTPKMASCPICGLTLQKKSYARHLRLHGNVVPEVCPYCNKEFREKRSLDKHIKAIHNAERPFACTMPDCNETFRNQVELKNHVNRHLKEYPFECDQCPMTFQKQDSLTTHYRSHTGEKPFQCEICDKSFTSEKNKKVHVQRHQGSLPHKCEVCSMTFQSRSHLIKHATSHNRRASTTIQVPAAPSNKMANFLESFSASLGDDMLGGMDFGDTGNDNSVRLSVDTIPDSLEAAAAEAAFALNQQDIPEELMEPSMIMPTTAASLALGQVTAQDQVGAGLLQCDICLTKLKDKRAYIVHMKKHAGIQSLKCKFCDLVLSGQQNFNKHIRTNHNMNPNEVQAIVVEEDFDLMQPGISGSGLDNEDNGSVLSSAESFRGQSGRGSVASSANFDPGLSANSMASSSLLDFVKCALCPEVFSSNELLQKHTATHFDAQTADDMLREKLLLSQTMRKKKKKKKRNPIAALSLSTSIPSSGMAMLPQQPMPGQMVMAGGHVGMAVAVGSKLKYRKEYSCLLCDDKPTFKKKESMRIHKIRHNGKGWKCQFCSELHETSSHLKNHLVTSHSMAQEDIEMLGILKSANKFVVMKKLKPPKILTEKSKPVPSDSSSADSDSDSDEAEDEDEDEIDYEDELEDEEDETTTDASTPTPFSIAPLLPSTNHPATTTAAAAAAAVAAATATAMLPSLVPSDPKDMFTSTKSQPIHAPSPTPSSSSGSGVPVLKFIEDESLFDLDALTCHACNKSFKNTRAFKLHRDRHQGALKHKCPECTKTFNGRSEVNRHMVAIHGRPLGDKEDTLHKKGDQAQKLATNTFDSSAINANTSLTLTNESDFSVESGVNLLNTTPTKMTSPLPMPVLMSSMSPHTPMHQNTTSALPMHSMQSVTNAAVCSPALSTGTLDLNNPTISTLSTIGSGLMLTSTPVPSMMTTPKTFPSVTPVMLDMPSLIEPELPKEKPVEEPEERDPTLTDDNCVLDPETGKLIKIEEPQKSPEPQPEPKPEPSLKDSKKVEKKAESIKKPNIVSESKVEPKQSQSAPISTVKVLPTMPILALPCLQTSSKVEQNKQADDADFEALIAPKKVNLKPTKETTGSTKVSGTDKAKNTDDNAQKVLSLDEKITSVKVTSPKAQEMIEDTIEVAAKAVIENSDNAPEKSDKTSAKDMTEEKSEKESKEEVKEEAMKDEQEGILPRRRGRSTLASSSKVTPLKKKKDKSPEEPSTTKEEVGRKNKKRKEILEPEKSPASRTEIKDETQRRLKKIEKEEESEPSSVTAKESESNVPKKKRGRPKRAQPEPEPSTSEDSSQEKEKENSSSTVQDSSPSIKEREPEKSGSTATPAPSVVKTDRKLPKQKGATHNKAGQKLIQPHKINLPEELCQIVENKKGKKMYQCQICSPKKEFNRKDIINYHAYVRTHHIFSRILNFLFAIVFFEKKKCLFDSYIGIL